MTPQQIVQRAIDEGLDVNLNTWKPHLEQLRKDRAEVLKRRWAAPDRVATLRDVYARQPSEVLTGN